jgi:signal transduction histidine kinase/ActR/RegA family two-component response regulator
MATALLFALVSAYVVWQVRATDYGSGGRTVANTARLVADDFQNSFDQLDSHLKSIGRQYVGGIEAGADQSTRLAEQMAMEISDHPFVARILVSDSNGRVVLGSGASDIALSAADVSDQEYFKKAAAGDRGLIFEGPVKAKFADEQVIILARRLEDGKGDYFGVIVASIPVDSFARLLSTLDLVEHGVVVLRTEDGVQIARYSTEPSERGVPGDSSISTALNAVIREHADRTLYEAVSPLDHIERLYAFQRFSHAPYFALVGLPIRALDQSWHRLAIELGLLCLGVTIAVLWDARRLLVSAESLDEERRLLRQRVADRTKELEETNHELIASEAHAEAANKAKSEFLANISHEIRTPLNAIMGMTQVLARSALDADQAGCVRMLDSAGHNMLVLLSEVLDLSKIEAGRLELNETPFLLAGVISSVVDTFAVAASSKGLTLRVEPLPDNLPAMLGDSIRLGQVLNNIVGNALKFTTQGGVTVSANALDRSPESVRIRVAVRDTGIGIATEHLGKLFEPFVQAERTTYRQFGGTGLGLAISKRLVGLMGGEIGVESERGKGSEFWFVVSFRVSSMTRIKETRPTAGHGENQLSRVRLLVVDDTETNREIAIKLLSLEGAICEPAENGRAAIERLRANPFDFDLVLMDVQMPDMDGLEATRIIRHDLGLVDLPVIALTAGTMASQREVALAAGMNGFVAKPFRLRELVAALSPWIRPEAIGRPEGSGASESSEEERRYGT